MALRVRCKNFALTYSALGHEEPNLERWMDDLAEGHADVIGGMVAKERHQDGQWHVHALLCFDETVEVRDPATLDVRGHHPNIKAAKNVKGWIEYIRKDGMWRSWGRTPGAPAKEGNLLMEVAKGMKNMQQALSEQPSLARNMQRNMQNIEMLRAVMQDDAHGRRDVQVYWLYGESDTGKSRWAHDNHPDAYRTPVTGRFWGNYQGQKTVVMDDYSPDQFTYKQLLRICDLYPVEIEVKGGHCNLAASLIIITSDKHPSLLYPNSWDRQLQRRLKYVVDFGNSIARAMFYTATGTADPRGPIVPSIAAMLDWEGEGV